MPWAVEVENADHIVSVTSEGPMRLVTVRQMAAEAIAAAPPEGERSFLADERRMLPQLTTQEIYELPAVLEGLGLRRTDRVAVVYTKGSPRASDFEFFEDVAHNQGFTVALFTEPGKARDWLKSR